MISYLRLLLYAFRPLYTECKPGDAKLRNYTQILCTFSANAHLFRALTSAESVGLN